MENELKNALKKAGVDRSPEELHLRNFSFVGTHSNIDKGRSFNPPHRISGVIVEVQKMYQHERVECRESSEYSNLKLITLGGTEIVWESREKSWRIGEFLGTLDLLG